MSVVTLPRRVEPRPVTRRREPVARHRAPRASAVAGWRRRPIGVKLAVIAVTALLVVMAGNSYAAQRQVEIHSLQTQLLQDQAHYAAQVAALTDLAAPARVAAQAGDLHLVVPTSVTQISSVPLNVPLPTIQLVGNYSITPRNDR